MFENNLNTQKARTGNRQGLLTLSLATLISSTLLASSAHGQDIGTLFTSPEEREYLDYLRDDFVRRSQLATFNIEEDVIPDIPEVEEEEVVEVEITEYNFGGVMLRRNGNRMVWLNGRQVAEGELPGNISLAETTAGTLLTIRNNGMNYQLKPGESVNLTNNAVNNSTQAPDSTATRSDQQTEPAPAQDNAANIPEIPVDAVQALISDELPPGELTREQAIDLIRVSLNDGTLGEQEANIAQAMLNELVNGDDNAQPDSSP